MSFEFSDITAYAKAAGIGGVLGSLVWLSMAGALPASEGADMIFYGALFGMSFPLSFDVLNWMAGN